MYVRNTTYYGVVKYLAESARGKKGREKKTPFVREVSTFQYLNDIVGVVTERILLYTLFKTSFALPSSVLFLSRVVAAAAVSRKKEKRKREKIVLSRLTKTVRTHL